MRLELHLSLALLCTACSAAPAEGDDDSQPATLPAEEGTLETTNSVGRSGAFYLPSRSEGAELPVLLAYHPTGAEGTTMVAVFRNLAEETGFAIVAPDSRVSPDGQFTWEVGDQPGEITEDLTHALACLEELAERLESSPSSLLAAGHSGGGSSAPYIATNHATFSAFAVLHGGVIAGGIGSNIIPGWLSTGEDDSIRPPDHIQDAADQLDALGFFDLRVEFYPGGHSINPSEAADLVEWWLEL
jgi:predicted esterase